MPTFADKACCFHVQGDSTITMRAKSLCTECGSLSTLHSEKLHLDPRLRDLSLGVQLDPHLRDLSLGVICGTGVLEAVDGVTDGLRTRLGSALQGSDVLCLRRAHRCRVMQCNLNAQRSAHAREPYTRRMSAFLLYSMMHSQSVVKLKRKSPWMLWSFILSV